MSRIPDYLIDMIRERTDLVALVSERVELKKKGKDYYGPCPFGDCGDHFSVVPKEQFFHCFVCGTSGDAFRFLTLHGMPFREAVALLGGRAGIDVEEDGSSPPPSYDPDAAKRLRSRLREERERKQEQEWARVARSLQERWDRAEPVRNPENHGYLVAKGITSAPGVRQEGDRLLIPMRAAETPDSLLMSLQAISPSGRKRFARGGRVQRTRTTIGTRSFLEALQGGVESPRLYICEGWATGWTIHHVTGDAVIVAFTAGNLQAIAEITRERYPEADIIIAADNDRWTECALGPNPGVIYARAAAEAIGGRVAIPEFGEVFPGEKRPTDFNDLWLLHGDDAVREWLDPEKAKDATIIQAPNEPVPPEEDAPPTLDAPSANGDGTQEDSPAPELTWLDSAPFRPIGYDHGVYYYLPRGTGQVSGFTVSGHGRDPLLSLAPLSWWEHHFGSTRGVSWSTAVDALFRACERSGVHRAERLRGRGCWHEDDGVVLHLGNRLLPPGAKQYVGPEDHESTTDNIYERLARIYGPSTKGVMELSGARDVLEMCRDLLWIEQASGDLLAGWIVLAPLAGVLSWRPHIWLTGSAGAGKSVILRDLVVPLLGGNVEYEGGTAWFFEGGTTEAGIRGKLRSDALPVVYDEAEKDRTGSRSDSNMQGVLALARSASSASGSHVVKGTRIGGSVTYQVASMFCLASISAGVRQEQDRTRVSILQLHSKTSVSPEFRAEHWRKYQPRLAGIDKDTGRLLMARTLKWLRDGRLAETIKVFKTAAAGILGDTRSGDQYGTLYAGAWTLMSEDVPDPAEAREIMGASDVGLYVQEQVSEGHKIMETILQAGARLELDRGHKTFAVGELVDALRPGNVAGGEHQDQARDWLNRHGMRVDVVAGVPSLLIANRSQWVENVLRNTPYGDNWKDGLRSIDGVVTNGPQTTFHAGLSSRVVIVPLDILEDEDATPTEGDDE